MLSATLVPSVTPRSKPHRVTRLVSVQPVDAPTIDNHPIRAVGQLRSGNQPPRCSAINRGVWPFLRSGNSLASAGAAPSPMPESRSSEPAKLRGADGRRSVLWRGCVPVGMDSKGFDHVIAHSWPSTHNQAELASAGSSVLALPLGIGTGSHPKGTGGASTVETTANDMMGPRRPVAINGRRKEFGRVNTPRMSAVLLDEADDIVETTITVIDADGRRTGTELVLLELVTGHSRRALLSDVTEKVKEQLGGPNGLNGVKAERSIREFYQDRRWLQLVVDNTDEPTPAGPAGMKKAA